MNEVADVTALAELTDVLEEGGVHAALRYLNSRTPHRFTGVYRYDGAMLRNECLFDRHAPEALRGDDVAAEDAYCSMLSGRAEPLEFADVANDADVAVKPGSPVISYCGALITTPEGEPFGSLCHFDFLPCQSRTSDAPLLEQAAHLVYRALRP